MIKASILYDRFDHSFSIVAVHSIQLIRDVVHRSCSQLRVIRADLGTRRAVTPASCRCGSLFPTRRPGTRAEATWCSGDRRTLPGRSARRRRATSLGTY